MPARSIAGSRSGAPATVASYGVGGGILEWWLERLRPERRLLLAEYAPATVERLRDLFPAAEVHRHDLLADPPLAADAHLFHRVDTELTDDRVARGPASFRPGAGAGRRHGGRDSAAPVQELLLRLRWRSLTRAGWLRTHGAFEALWRDTHEARPLRLHDLEGWSLEPRG